MSEVVIIYDGPGEFTIISGSGARKVSLQPKERVVVKAETPEITQMVHTEKEPR